MLLLSAAGPLVPGAFAASKAATPPSEAATSAALGREALAVLAAADKDPDPEVRAVAAEAWGDLGNRAALPALKRALADDKPDVRIAAASALVKLGDIEGLIALIDETKPIKIGPAANPAEELRRMARDAARARAVLKLGETGKDPGVPTLRKALSDASGEVRDAAAVALARMGRGDSDQFLAAMKDPDEGVRASAARSLGLIGREGLDLLKKALSSDASANVRAEAAAALGSFDDADAVRLLAAALHDKSGRVRLSAARALARRPAPESTTALKALADSSPAPELGLVAAAALADRGQDPDLGLAELTLGQNDPDLKALAVEVLAGSRRPEARELLLKAMRGDGDARVRARAAAALVRRLRGAGGAAK